MKGDAINTISWMGEGERKRERERERERERVIYGNQTTDIFMYSNIAFVTNGTPKMFPIYNF